MIHRITDHVKGPIVRSIPNWAAISTVIGLFTWAIGQYTSYVKVVEATERNTVEVRTQTQEMKNLAITIRDVQLSNAVRDAEAQAVKKETQDIKNELQDVKIRMSKLEWGRTSERR